MKVKHLIEKLSKMDQEADIVAPLWVVDDVECIAEQRGIALSDEQRTEIMYQMERNHNADIGINWDVIDATIDWVAKY